VTPADETVIEARVIRQVHPGLSLDVSLSLGCEIGVLFGPSGAGKTTLLRLISGLATPDRGRIRLGDATLFDSEHKVDQPLRQRRIGMIFQDDRLFPHLNVAANIRFGLKGWPRDLAAVRMSEVTTLCGVEHLLKRAPETLSGGERQRVGLARALAPRPRLLLCDEPVSALDLANRHALIEQLRAVQRALAIPMIYVTHSPTEALALGSRLFLLQQGKIVAEGPPLDVLGTGRGAPAGSIAWEDVRNIFPACIVGHVPEHGATHLKVDQGPDLVVPFLERDPGTRLLVEVRADDILLASQPIGGLSARNQFAGTVDRVVAHGALAEAVIRTGGLTWIVSLVAPAVEQLELVPGCTVHMIIKARSCHVVEISERCADR
jgi:molybdate transport system ATP-binding protein